MNRPLRVAYIMSRFPKLSETFVLNEMVALERQGHSVEVFPLLDVRSCISQPDAIRFAERAHYLPFLSWTILRAQCHFLRQKPRQYLGLWLEVLRGTFGSANFLIGGLGIIPKAVLWARQLESLSVDHVHAHFANHPTVAALVVHRLLGVPFSFTTHAHDLYVDQRMLGEKVRAASFVVAISEHNRAFIVRHCGEEVRDKVVVVHCGVDTDLFCPLPRTLTSGPFSIVCIGSLEEKKGQTYLIEACRSLQETGFSFTCQLVGEGADRVALERQIHQAGLEKRVRLLGGRSQPYVRALLQTADVVALPSIMTKAGKMEGIPVALMEPLACGVPVVSTRTSGIPELVEDGVTGLLVPPNDAAALAEALLRLARDPALRERLGTAGREKVLREFDLARSAEQLVQLMRGGGRCG